VIGIPRVVRNKALTVDAAPWLRDLPDLIAALERATPAA
jgi:hypothetical protein